MSQPLHRGWGSIPPVGSNPDSLYLQLLGVPDMHVFVSPTRRRAPNTGHASLVSAFSVVHSGPEQDNRSSEVPLIEANMM